MNTQDKIGKLILDGLGERDAIHVAIAPVTASETLRPGQQIGFLKDSIDLVGDVENCIGIVDPFLTLPVAKGQRFFMLLYPNTITSLRHEWTHPAFAAAAERDESEKWLSEKWLRAYAAKHSPYDDPEVAFRNMMDGLRCKEVFYHGDDLHGLDELKDADELKRHAEAYLGIEINWGEYSFSCSC